MLVLYLVFGALLATTTTGQSDIARYVRGQWIIADESPQYEQYEGTDEGTASPAAEEGVWPESTPEAADLVTVKDWNLPTTPGSYVVKEQDSDEGEQSSVWKFVLVAAVLLVSVVGTLSMAYYMCVWRGGRIHYQPQKDNDV